MAKRGPLFILFLLLLSAGAVQSRHLAASPEELRQHDSHSRSCDQTYGLLFCATSVVGNLLIIGGLFYLSAKCIAAGNELLIRRLGPGVVGGLILPAMDALPESVIILVSGLSGSREVAQREVVIGMGMLSGSSIMLLTLLWGSCILLGSVNFAKIASPRFFTVEGSAVTTDKMTTYAARIMVVSLIPLITVQVPKLLHLSWESRRLAVSASLIVSLAFLVSYCLYQVFQPWIQRRRLDYAKQRHLISGLLRQLNRVSQGKLVNSEGEPNIRLLEKLFDRIDRNSDGSISAAELRALVVGIQCLGDTLDPEEAVNQLMKEFDESKDNTIDRREFVAGVSEWIQKAKRAGVHHGGPSVIQSVPSNYFERTKAEYERLLLKKEDEEEDAENAAEDSSWGTVKALLLLLVGTLIAGLFSKPLVDAVVEFSSATSIPTFYVSFVALPMATNLSEAVTACSFARLREKRAISLAFSEIYGRLTMNNTLCLSVFLALVYTRQLSWDFSAETLVIFVVSVTVGVLGSLTKELPLWACWVAYGLYPSSLLLVYLLDDVLGWP